MANVSNPHVVAGSIVTAFFPILSWEARNLWTGYAVWGLCVSIWLSICFISVRDASGFIQWTTPAQLNKTGLTSAISRRSVWQLFLLLRPPANEQQRETVPSQSSRKCLQWAWAYLITQCMARRSFTTRWHLHQIHGEDKYIRSTNIYPRPSEFNGVLTHPKSKV